MIAIVERRDEGRPQTDRARDLRRKRTEWEVALYRRLRKSENRWRRSHPIFGYYLDLYCDVARLAVEVDGVMHDPDYDARRDEKVAEAGILTLRFTNTEVGVDCEACVQKIREIEAARVEMLRKARESSSEPAPLGEGREGVR